MAIIVAFDRQIFETLKWFSLGIGWLIPTISIPPHNPVVDRVRLALRMPCDGAAQRRSPPRS